MPAAYIVLARLVGEALAVGALVVDDGDLLVVELLGEEGAGDRALLVVAAADAKRARAGTLVGEFRVGRSRRDLDDARLPNRRPTPGSTNRSRSARRRGRSSWPPAGWRPRPPASGRRRRRRFRATSFCPRTPPLALRSATACSTPSFICLPNAAYWPVIGPAVAIAMSAWATPESAIPKDRATPALSSPFIEFSPGKRVLDT